MARHEQALNHFCPVQPQPQLTKTFVMAGLRLSAVALAKAEPGHDEFFWNFAVEQDNRASPTHEGLLWH
jgi:hypothetical protein